jgi:2,4-dichlorophenol 6-monooxygenase
VASRGSTPPISRETGLPISAVSIGPGHELEDPYGAWAGLSEIADDGVLLVRPDLYVAARHAAGPASASEAGRWLRSVLAQVLGTGA